MGTIDRVTIENQRMPMVLARPVSLRSPYSTLWCCLHVGPAGWLSPSSQATPSPCEVRLRFLPTHQCLGPLQPAWSPASHQGLRGARQCFWVYIAFGSLTVWYRTAGCRSLGPSVRGPHVQNFASPKAGLRSAPLSPCGAPGQRDQHHLGLGPEAGRRTECSKAPSHRPWTTT